MEVSYIIVTRGTGYETLQVSKAITKVMQFMLRRQCGRVVRAPDLKSGGPEFKSRSDRYLELFHGRPGFISSTTLVNSQLVCLLPVGIFNLLCSV